MAKYKRKVCLYCKEKIKPDYKEVSLLKKFTSEKGKIIPRSKNGMCAKHGRLLSTAIKRARYMALMQYTAKVK